MVKGKSNLLTKRVMIQMVARNQKKRKAKAKKIRKRRKTNKKKQKRNPRNQMSKASNARQNKLLMLKHQNQMHSSLDQSQEKLRRRILIHLQSHRKLLSLQLKSVSQNLSNPNPKVQVNRMLKSQTKAKVKNKQSRWRTWPAMHRHCRKRNQQKYSRRRLKLPFQ